MPAMTTAKRLWLGFGILTVLLVVSTVAIMLRGAAIEADVEQMADARSRSIAARQLESHVLGYALNVRTFAETADPKARHDALNEAALVERSANAYERFAITDQQRHLAGQFALLWQRLKAAGHAVLDGENSRARAELLRMLYQLRVDLERFLEDELQAEARAANTARIDAVRQGVRTVWALAGVLLGVGVIIAALTSTLVGRGIVRAERELRQNREWLRVTLASIGDAVITTDNEARVTFLNKAAETLTGWNRDEAAGVPLEQVFLIVSAGTRERAANPALRALKEGVIVGLANHTVLIAKDGAERPIDDSAAPIRDEAGKVAGCVLIFRDVTERQRADDALRQYAAELSEADRRKNEFLAMLAHELRNPLAPINNIVQVLKTTGANDPVLASALPMMERQTSHMVRLLDDLLDASRVSRGQIELRKQPVELASAVHHAIEASRPAIDLAGHRLNHTLPAEPIFLDADPARMTQVLSNLLNNACKFTGTGGSIALIVERAGGQAIIRVRDSGIGIARDQLLRIFDLFVQVDTAIERSVSGLGIGLALVRNLVEMHDGTIEAHSPGLGHGSEFVVRLPIMAVAANVASAPPAASGPAPGRRILVVDDNQDSATSFALLLELAGNETYTAFDGAAALEVASKVKPDALLLDIGLPKLNGYEVCRRIRGEPWGKTIVIVAMTGWGQDDDRRKTREAGFDSHLVKPVDVEALNALLARNLRGERVDS